MLVPFRTVKLEGVFIGCHLVNTDVLPERFLLLARTVWSDCVSAV